ncbi:MAG TPA: adenylate/guanylate cyclase domain-containing protein [Gammaproteobacteria bacterium]|nr:adenylate/guanylate cyclase domain-containing protein [Gammaproteobacteria bacterium]
MLAGFLFVTQEQVMGEPGKRYDIITVVFVFLLAIVLEYREAFSLIEDETLSYRQILRTHYANDEYISPSEDVVIVYTDEDFYAEYDKYPLRRVDLSTIILHLKDMGAKVIGVDMLLDFKSAYGEDPTLADALEEAGNVLLVSQGQIEGDDYLGVNRAIDKFASLTQDGYSNISANSAISESIVRLRVHTTMSDNFDAWPFAVKAVSMFLDDADIRLEDHTLSIGEEIEVALDQFYDLYIDYPLLPPSEEGTARLHEVVGMSVSELLFAIDEEELEDLASLVDGKIVLVGEVAEVAHDEFETPVGNVYGVEIIANTIATILRNGPLTAASLWLEIIVCLNVMSLFVLSRSIQEPFLRNLFSFGIAGVFIAGVVIAYISFGLIISLSYVLIASLISIVVINSRFYLNEMGQKALIRDMFGHYLSPEVVADLVRTPEKLALGGEERVMTAFFSDIAKFSTFSESMEPTELVTVLNEYLTGMCNIIIASEGTVDKFEGDLIMAFWGAPTFQEAHAKLACFASIDQRKELAILREKWVSEGLPEIQVRMGVHTGPMVVGNMGSAQKLNYTIMGDAVNLASRLEGANKAYDTYAMISEDTYMACHEHIDARELDTIRVVGKSDPVTVYQLLERKNQTEGKLADLVDLFARALALYKEGNYQDALAGFKDCLKLNPEDGPALAFVTRCESYIANPLPDDWDHVFTLVEKG